MRKHEIQTVVAAIAASAMLAGCETISGTTMRRQEADAAALKASMERQRMAYDVGVARSAAQSAEVRIDQQEKRLERIEAGQGMMATSAEVVALRRDLDAARSEIAAVKADRAAMKREIIDEISKEVAALIAKRDAQVQRTVQHQSAAQTGYEHKVQAGQTLSDIARAYGVTVEKIKQANNLKSDMIRVGQTLFIPD
ncbi:MAG: LysM peptidoglycan-binding domain-containing protein [Kiritimatiellae bacterium]|nr:LysM peptidoglycan-binding domain-containing protein [Kiritimatiellia bacterium]